MRDINFNKLLFPLSLVFVFALGYFLTIGSPVKNSIIKIEAVPAASRITIDGKSARDGVNKVIPGVHTVKVSVSGFATQVKTLSLSAGDNAYAGFVLQSNSPDTQNWYSDNPADQKLAETISSHDSDYASSKATTSNSLLQILPYNYGDGHGGLVTIDSGIPLSNKTTQPAIYITASTPADRQGALQWVRSRGYNPAQMDIVFYGTRLGFNPEGN